MDRRTFLTAAVGAFGAATLSGHANAAASNRRTLVLVELAGGNDGLNTVIPFDDPAYAAARPRIAINRDQALHLDHRLGLHPALEPLMAGWKSRDLAVIRGVGYDRPNRSHFRSIDIWETASDSNQVLKDGWIARILKDQKRDARSVADAVVLGGKSSRIVAGDGIKAVSMTNPERFVRQARGLKPLHQRSENPALAHILSVQSQIDRAAYRLGEIAARTPEVRGRFQGRLGRQLRVAARLILAEARIPVIKVSLGGFDTHANQPGRHRNLMRQLGTNMASFRDALKQGGAWERTLVMTYSEFGRRVRQNGSGGTDHGTAAPHLMLGGRVRGGLYGAQPSLTNLDAGDMRYAVDYRRSYATAAQEWLQVSSAQTVFGAHRPLGIIRG